MVMLARKNRGGRGAEPPWRAVAGAAAIGLMIAQGAVQAAEGVVEQAGLRLLAAPRTPDQIAAFYAARGLPAAAVSELAAACVITFSLRNGRDDVVWLEPERWRFTDSRGKAVRRFPRSYWKQRWEVLSVPLAGRATFGWSQLPEQRDLRPGEPVGGNLTLAPVDGEFSLEARFITGADRRGPELVLRLATLRCPREGSPEAGP